MGSSRIPDESQKFIVFTLPRVLEDSSGEKEQVTSDSAIKRLRKVEFIAQSPTKTVHITTFLESEEDSKLSS